MGYKRLIVTAVIAILLFFTSFLTNRDFENRSIGKKIKLSNIVHNIDDWSFIDYIPLDVAIQNELKLDDFLYARFHKDRYIVSLYVGYYFNHSNIGAAHDPLVCFPGQGWVLTEKGRGTAQVPGFGESIEYSTMKATRGSQKEQLLYWFQVADGAVADTVQQKIESVKYKFQGKSGQNAFVRITCPVQEEQGDCLASLREFAVDFYPYFQRYINNQL